ncbi:hypothetical protein Pcinc_028936 [Petrolisthes cinctipes]|uniref:poly(ADP-ribose) glycohydrolase n=1 Tax=Petrolisthes cinctipes TaxID=88211 RepID=A0AAE1F1X5_PETCI|nr:hypothetical protein Pcinc_028936 [Petrolisthes cinctipes]
MFMPSTSKGCKKRGEEISPTREGSSNSSQVIESSIECIDLESSLPDKQTAINMQPTGTKKQQEDSPSREHQKSIENHSNKEMEKNIEKTSRDLEKGQLEMSHKRKNKDEYDEVMEKYESGGGGGGGGGRRSADNKGKEGKGQGNSSSHKLYKKVTPRKSPKKSTQMEKNGHEKCKEASNLRSILASAAERRIKATVPSSSKAVSSTHQLSPDLFEDEDTDNRTKMGEQEVHWRGSPLSSLTTLSSTNLNLPSVSPSPTHTVMVKLPLSTSGPALPHPTSYTDVWDQHHVRMPCSPRSQYPLSKNSDVIVSRWSVICQALCRDMSSVEDFQKVVLEYNTRYASKWKFRGLQYLLERELEEEESEHFFHNTLPAIASLALRLPQLVTQAPPLLTKHTTHSVTFSQLQIASLLANAFFCTFPRRNAKGSETEYASYPDINFNRLFFHKEKRALEKLKCIINYFRRITIKEPTGNVTFTRQHISTSDLPSWLSCTNHLPRLHVDTVGLIEEAEGLLQVDFANKFLGGGVLGLGCVQEEIRFVLSPELLISRLFTQVLDNTEALIITGVEQFNSGNGYSSTFIWGGSCQDTTPRDLWGRRLCQVTAIDALHFTKQPQIQYRESFIKRELNKAYAGFRVLDKSTGAPIAVATGNWGCGAFRGNPRLKALIQLAACAYVGRDLAYFTFGDEKLRDDLVTMYIFLKENNVTVGALVQVLNQHGARGWGDGSDFFQYIYHSLRAYDSDTDSETTTTTKPLESDVPVSSHNSRGCPRVISDYFKRSGPSTSRSSSSSTSHKNPQSKPLPQSSYVTEGGAAIKDSLSEEKILQVLSECDRLIEGQKSKDKMSAECFSTSDDKHGVGLSHHRGRADTLIKWGMDPKPCSLRCWWGVKWYDQSLD